MSTLPIQPISPGFYWVVDDMGEIQIVHVDKDMQINVMGCERIATPDEFLYWKRAEMPEMPNVEG